MPRFNATKSFLNSQRKAGALAKKKGPGKPTTEAIIQKALTEGNEEFFNRSLSDEMEQRMWVMFLTGKAMQLDEKGNPVMAGPENGEKHPVFYDIELNPISWKAFEKMVSYKRGVPVPESTKKQSARKMTVNFNIMGVSPEQMEKKVRDLGFARVLDA